MIVPMNKALIFLLTLAALLGSALAQVPASKHVVIVMEENHSYSSVIGSSSMPYLNSLANKYGLATQYYANTHPSIGNYFMLTTGAIITNNDSYSGTVSQDNIVRHILTAGKTWKSYAENLPYVGYTGGDKTPYIKHHNPEAFFTDVANSSVQKLNLVPFPQFATDLANGQLPDFTFVVPNQNDNAHNGTLATADSWLKTNIEPLIASPAFQTGGDGILFIVFDESTSSDLTHGGGHVACVVVSPNGKPAFKSTSLFQHQSVLKTIMAALGMTSFPGAAETAPSMAEFFGTGTPPPPPTTPTVTIQTPASGAAVATTFTITAMFNKSSATYMKIWVDGVAQYSVSNTASVSHTLTVAAGKRRLTVQASYGGAIYTITEYINAQ
jgi:phosphatidylinositol-3-phosphatase